MAKAEVITIHGARQHNLQNLDLEIPKGCFTTISGVSGSGKSSLAFDTLYAEGQRCYVESLSTYARQFLERLEKPDVDSIEGIQPSIAIRQRNTVKSSRSTVGTSTEIHDYLRLLYARVGHIHCLHCGTEVKPDTPDDAVRRAREQFREGTRLLVTFPVAPTATLPFAELASRLVAQGYLRAIHRGKQRSLEEAWSSPVPEGKEFSVIADRIVWKASNRLRLAEAVEAALHAGEGRAAIVEADSRKEISLSDRYLCPRCQREYEEPTPQLFSFNSPQGACPDCNGFGERLEFDERRIVPDLDRSLSAGAVRPWCGPAFANEMAALLKACKKRKIPIDLPYRKLSGRQKAFVLEAKEKDYLGVIPWLASMRDARAKEGHRFYTRRYLGRSRCRSCDGKRLRPQARAVKVGGLEIGEVAEMDIPAARGFLASLELSSAEKSAVADVLQELLERLEFLERIGLEYLSLSRASRTLSGGEMQRIHLSNALASRLVETLYVLDEPSIGLHPADTDRLLGRLKELAEMGNTVVVVEHDSDILRASDHLIDLGPGAGVKGGRILYQGPPPGNGAVPKGARGSLTCEYLSGRRVVKQKSERRSPGRRRVTLVKARLHNLAEIDFTLPLGLFVCVTGVSGSGKSTLVNELLYPALTGRIFGGQGRLHGFDAIHGAENVDQVVLVDQSPIGRSSRSNPATYLQVLTEIRGLLAQTAEARKRGWTAGRFSFNLPGGRCPVCQGLGEVTVEMQFMADVTVPCEECRGRRFEPSTLEVRYRGRNIAEILDLTVDEALSFFVDSPAIGAKLWLLQKVGLGYLKLGQPAGTLSGGESQRIKIARELLRGQKEHTLYLLDEPTTGLHPEDVRKLLSVLDDLVDKGNTVMVIEHNLDVIKNADWVVDLGPGGGPKGGRIVVAGPPESLVENEQSITGRHLAAAIHAEGKPS